MRAVKLMRKSLRGGESSLKVKIYNNNPLHLVKAASLLFGTLLYLSMSDEPLAESDPSNGYEVYIKNCIICHGEDGAGAMPGVPDLNETPKWLMKTDEILIEQIKQGIQTSESAVAMPPKGGNPDLSDKDIRDVVIYMKKTFSK